MDDLKKYSEYFVYVCGIFLFASVLIISIEVFLRKFFLISFGGTDEITGYILGISITWSLAFVLFEKMHIRMDVLYNKFSLKGQNFLDIVSLSITLVFVVFLTYFAYDVFLISYVKSSTANTPLGTPLWIPQLIWFLGFLFFLIVLIFFTFKSIKAFIYNKIEPIIHISREEK